MTGLFPNADISDVKIRAEYYVAHTNENNASVIIDMSSNLYGAKPSYFKPLPPRLITTGNNPTRPLPLNETYASANEARVTWEATRFVVNYVGQNSTSIPGSAYYI